MTDARKGALLSLTSAFLGAAFLIPFKAAGQIAPGRGVVFALLLAAATLNTLTAWSRRSGRRRPRGNELVVSLALAVCTVVGNLAVLAALAVLEPAITSVVTHSQVFLVVALAWPLLGERPTVRFAIGAGLALAGFALMQAPGAGGGDIATAGLGLALLAAAMWAAMQVITRAVASRIDLVLVNAVRLWLATAALACAPGTLAAARDMPATAWALAGAAAFAGPFLSRIALMYSVRYISASHSTLIGLIGPVFAFLLGLAAFGSAPAPLEIAGGLILLAGIALPVLELTGGHGRSVT
jgi:drug/metabolite transporter (DMT)-like permease